MKPPAGAKAWLLIPIRYMGVFRERKTGLLWPEADEQLSSSHVQLHGALEHLLRLVSKA